MIETHYHFSGAISTDFLWNVIKERHWWHLANDKSHLEKALKFKIGGDFEQFLNNFRIYDEIRWDESLIIQSIDSVVEELSKQNIEIAWIDFSINKYLNHLNISRKRLIELFYERFQRSKKTKIALVLSVKYESLEATRSLHLDIIKDREIRDLLHGIDVVGDEKYFDVEFYKKHLASWYDAGKMVRMHLGEVDGYENLKRAIRSLPITNIAHGIQVIKSVKLCKEAKERGLQFDLALTSNIALCKDMTILNHPIKEMIDRDLCCTISSDDPEIFSTNLGKEFELANKVLDQSQIEQLKANAQKFSEFHGVSSE